MDPYNPNILAINDLKTILCSLSDEQWKEQIEFQELLIVGKFENDKHPTPVGGLCLNVTRSLRDKSKLVVYLRSQFNVNGRKAGSKITSWLDKSFLTIEEKRVEWIDNGESENEPSLRESLYVSLQKDHVYVRRSNTWEPAAKTKYPLELHDRLINEGASFALMRVLAISKYIGKFESSTLNLKGDLCRNTYICFGPESGIVNDTKMDICYVYRKIINDSGAIHMAKTTLTTSGRIIQHEWINCNYVIHLNPLESLDNEDGKKSFQKTNWCDDLQLLSIYLDRKELCKSRLKSYLRDRGDIKNVLADYVQSILQMKPEDVLQFTIDYFSRFKHLDTHLTEN